MVDRFPFHHWGLSILTGIYGQSDDNASKRRHTCIEKGTYPTHKCTWRMIAKLAEVDGTNESIKRCGTKSSTFSSSSLSVKCTCRAGRITSSGNFQLIHRLLPRYCVLGWSPIRMQLKPIYLLHIVDCDIPKNCCLSSKLLQPSSSKAVERRVVTASFIINIKQSFH